MKLPPIIKKTSLLALCIGSFSLIDNGFAQGKAELVVIEFQKPSMAEMVAEHRKQHGEMPEEAEQRKYAEKLRDYQESKIDTIESTGAKVLHKYRVTINGLKIKATPDQIQMIKDMGMVKEVRPVNKFSAPRQLNLTNTDAFDSSYYEQLNLEKLHKSGNTGKGLVIAIIDTGVNYYLEGLGGNVPYAESRFINDDPTIIEKVEQEYTDKNGNTKVRRVDSFPTQKVIAGYDLAGSRYSGGNDTPMPDPDPYIPGNFHGSLSGSNAAGEGGPNFPKGVAPDAKIMAIKIFGDLAQGTALTAEAIDYALDPNGDGILDDSADVINLSLGKAFGTLRANSAEQLAVERAIMLGVPVIASAGNNDQTPFSVDSPSVFEGAISVGAAVSENEGKTIGLELNSNKYKDFVIPTFIFNDLRNQSELPTQFRFLPSFDNVKVIVPSQYANCQPLSGDFTNKIVLIKNECLPNGQANQASEANAHGVIVVDATISPNTVISNMYLTNGLNIPAWMVGDYHGNLLIKESRTAQGASLSFVNGKEYEHSIFNFTPASYTSRGPDAGTFNFKPDIVVANQAFNQFGDSIAASGTSFSAPIIAGLVALIKQKHPKADPAEIKARILNSAKPIRLVNDGVAPYAPLTLQGVGMANAGKSLRQATVATPAAASFGYIHAKFKKSYKEKIVIRNKSNSTKNYTTKIKQGQKLNGATLSAPKQFSIPPKSQREITLTLDINPNAFPKKINTVKDIDGWLEIKEGKNTIRMGYMAFVEPVSNVKAKVVNDGLDLSNNAPLLGSADQFLHVPYFSVSQGREKSLPTVGARLVKKGKNHYLELAARYNIRSPLPLFPNHMTGFDINICPESSRCNGQNSFSKKIMVLDSGFASGGLYKQTPVAINTDEDFNFNGIDTAGLTIKGPEVNSNYFIVSIKLPKLSKETLRLTLTTRALKIEKDNADVKHIGEGEIILNSNQLTRLSSLGRQPASIIHDQNSSDHEYMWLFTNNNPQENIFIH